MISGTSTKSFYESASLNMSGLRKRTEDLQSQITSESRISRSSDNPVVASRLRNLSRAETLSEADLENANRVTTDLEMASDTMMEMSNMLNRVRELSLLAANGTISEQQRKDVSNELLQIQNGLFAMANAEDSAGYPLFGGGGTGQAYTYDAAGNPVYSGGGSSGDLRIGDGMMVGRGMTGPEFLHFDVNGSPTNAIAVVKQLTDAIQTGSPDPVATARDTLAALDKGIETLSTAQSHLGARMAWIDLAMTQRTNVNEFRAQEKKEIGGVDLATTITELQQTMTVLQASQASFAQLSSLSLFNVLR